MTLLRCQQHSSALEEGGVLSIYVQGVLAGVYKGKRVASLPSGRVPFLSMASSMCFCVLTAKDLTSGSSGIAQSEPRYSAGTSVTEKPAEGPRD